VVMEGSVTLWANGQDTSEYADMDQMTSDSDVRTMASIESGRGHVLI
jgi:hypothetical protein